MKECCRKFLLEQFGDDEEILNAIYSEYATSAAVKTAEAETALANGSWDELSRVAHAIKGNALAAGDRMMTEAAVALRNAASLRDRERSEKLIADMKALTGEL